MFIFKRRHAFDISSYGIGLDLIQYGNNLYSTTAGGYIVKMNLIEDINADEVANQHTITGFDISSSLIGRPEYIRACGGSLWIFDGSVSQYAAHTSRIITHIHKVNASTYEVEETIQLPKDAQCIPACGAGKIWLTTMGIPEDDTQQEVFYYEPSSKTFTIGDPLGTKHQLSPRNILFSGDQYVFISASNNNSVIKVNIADGTVASEIVINRAPYAMYVNDSKELLVGSFNGLVSTVNITTDVVSHDYGTIGIASHLVDTEDGFIWALTPNLVRVKTADTTDNFRIMDGNDLDTSIKELDDGVNVFKNFIVSKPFTADVWNTTTEATVSTSVPSYFCLLTNTKVYIAKDFTDSWDINDKREASVQVRCTAIISTGEEKYYGESIL